MNKFKLSSRTVVKGAIVFSTCCQSQVDSNLSSSSVVGLKTNMRVASKVQKAQEKQKRQKDETDEIETKEDERGLSLSERILPLSEENLSIIFDEEMMNLIEAITYREMTIDEQIDHFSSVQQALPDVLEQLSLGDSTFEKKEISIMEEKRIRLKVVDQYIDYIGYDPLYIGYYPRKDLYDAWSRSIMELQTSKNISFIQKFIFSIYLTCVSSQCSCYQMLHNGERSLYSLQIQETCTRTLFKRVLEKLCRGNRDQALAFVQVLYLKVTDYRYSEKDNIEYCRSISQGMIFSNQQLLDRTDQEEFLIVLIQELIEEGADLSFKLNIDQNETPLIHWIIDNSDINILRDIIDSLERRNTNTTQLQSTTRTNDVCGFESKWLGVKLREIGLPLVERNNWLLKNELETWSSLNRTPLMQVVCKFYKLLDRFYSLLQKESLSWEKEELQQNTFREIHYQKDLIIQLLEKGNAQVEVLLSFRQEKQKKLQAGQVQRLTQEEKLYWNLVHGDVKSEISGLRMKYGLQKQSKQSEIEESKIDDETESSEYEPKCAYTYSLLQNKENTPRENLEIVLIQFLSDVKKVVKKKFREQGEFFLEEDLYLSGNCSRDFLERCYLNI